MRLFKLKIFVLTLAFPVLGFTQEKVQLLYQVGVEAQMVEVDNIGNIYTLSEGEIKKFDLKGELLAKNSALAFGAMSGLDASNALKMILFFKDLSQIVYLDNLLSARGDPIQLDVLGYYQTQASCRSYNDGLWVFDQTTFELTRLTEQLAVSAQSGNLAQVIGDIPSITYLREVNNWLYALDSELGIFVFDWYGSYTKTIPIKGADKFVIRANKLFFLADGNLELMDLATSKFAKLEIPEIEVKSFSVYENNLIILTKNQLRVYRLIIE